MKTKITLAKLIISTSIPAPLVRAVVRQMGGWNYFVEHGPDITRHGINGGFNGFTHHTETEAFAKRNRESIAAMAKEQASDFGTSTIEMIQNFGCFRNDKPNESSICTALYGGKAQEDTGTVLNALAWYAGEEVSRAYCDMIENEQPPENQTIMKTYIQRRCDDQLETVDEFDTRKEAHAMLAEYRMADPSAHYYLSSRCCKDWRD